MSLSFSYGGHSATSIDALYVFFTSFIITSVSCNGATPSSNVPFLLIYVIITLLQYGFSSHRAPSSTSIFRSLRFGQGRDRRDRDRSSWDWMGWLLIGSLGNACVSLLVMKRLNSAGDEMPLRHALSSIT